MSLDAMKQALDTLESSRIFVTSREKIKHPEGTELYDAAITALRAAIEQAQEPVSLNNGRLTQYPDGSIGVGTPPQRKPLGAPPTSSRRLR
jgi:hypothetical protein